MQAEAYDSLREVLSLAGDTDAARDAFEEAIRRYERKQIIPLARRTRERLETLQSA